MEFTDKILGKMLTDEDAKSCPMPKTVFPKDTPLAMAYIPFQHWDEVYEAEVGFSRGTIFPALDKPFIGEEAVKNAHS